MLDTLFAISLVLSLGSPSYTAREVAQAELAKLHVHPFLEWGMQHKDAEIATRCKKVMHAAYYETSELHPARAESIRDYPPIDFLPPCIFANWGWGIAYDPAFFLARAKKEWKGQHGAPYYDEYRYATYLFGVELEQSWGPNVSCGQAAVEAHELDVTYKFLFGD